MINREWKKVTIISYDNSLDEYGQKRHGSSSQRVVDMVCKNFSMTNTDDVRFTEVTDLGLTKDKDITDADTILIDNDRYEVLYVRPTARLNQIMMRKLQ